MRRFVFMVEEHEEYGTKGLRPAWMPDGDPLSGMATAHDCLEHVPATCRVGEAEGEFMALGAALWLRGGGGYWTTRSPGEHIGADLPDILRRVESGAQTLTDPGRTCRVEDWAEAEMAQGLTEGVRECRGQEVEVPADARERIRGWMRRGFRASGRRYGHHDAYHWAHLFAGIEKDADRALAQAEEGYRVVVLIDFTSVTHRLWVEWEVDYGRWEPY